MNKVLIFFLLASVIGFGLYAEHNDRKINDTIATISTDDVSEISETIIILSDDDIVDVIDELKCVSGGEGTTNCAVSAGGTIEVSCSVTCEAGYYACCGIKGCHCRKIQADKISH